MKEKLITDINNLAVDFWTMNLHNGTFESHLTKLIDDYEKAINYTRCCETFEGKEVPTFDEWKKQNKITKSKCGKKLADNEGYVFEEWELIDKYNYEVMNL
jgi:hypothetical protein